jgi:hypothetical protein
MQDAGVALRKYCLDDPDIDYLVDGRVYVEDIPDAEISNMPRKCIVFRAMGGIEQNDYAELAVPRYDVWCYGETRIEAGKVDRALWDALHFLQRSTKKDTLLHSVILSGGPRAAKEPDTGWPVQIRSITVRVGTASTE